MSNETSTNLLDGEALVAAVDVALASGDGDGARKLLDETDGSSATSSLQLRRAIAELSNRKTAVDDSLMTLDRLATATQNPDELSEDERIIVHSHRIQCATRKRIRSLADRAVATAADAELAKHADVLVATGQMHQAFDERPAALAAYHEAIEKTPNHVAARLAVAKAHYVLGEFAEAIKVAETVSSDSARRTSIVGDRTVPTADQASQALRTCASCHAATGNYSGEVACYQRLINETGDQSTVVGDRLNLAFAMAAAGDYEGCEVELRLVQSADPESGRGRYARVRLDHLTRVRKDDEGPIEVKRLKQFPTTSQKHNYCGPAVLELCLSFLELELTQDEIAAVVKREHGTPMYEITAFLASRDISARRIEATPEKIRGAIDLGLPVIVQEEYSTTSHVAVITGYDARLGTFIANDPATHRPTYKSFEWTESSGDLFGNGGVVVLGRNGDQALAELQQQADELGLIDEDHLSLLDSIDRHRQEIESDKGPEVARRELINICDRAIEKSSRFRLAWYRKLHALLDLCRISQSDGALEQFVDYLHRVRVMFPYDEWTHQLHGHFLDSRGRSAEAFAEYLQASRLDTSDSNNRQWMGECKGSAGDLRAAEKHLYEALALDPEQQRAAENMAGMLVRQLEALVLAEADDDNSSNGDSDDSWSPRLQAQEVHVAIDRTREDLLARASYFSDIALHGHGDNPFNHFIAGSVSMLEGDAESALTHYNNSLERDSTRPHTHMASIHALLAVGRDDDALESATKLTTDFADFHKAWLLLAEVHRRAGRDGDAQQALVQGAESCRHEREEFAEPIYVASKRVLGSAEAAGSVLRDIAEASWGDSAFMRRSAYILDRNHQRGHAIAMLRHVLSQSPSDLQSMYRLGGLLSEDVTTKAEGRALLEQVRELAPDSPAVITKLAWLYLDDEAEAGLELTASLLDSEDPHLYEVTAALAEAAGKGELAETMRAKATGSFRTEADAHIRLGWYHVNYNRYDLGLQHAQALSKLELDEKEKDEAEDLEYTSRRLSGRCEDLLERARKRCEDEVPKHLAFDIYYAFRSLDPLLAARAAMVVASEKSDPVELLEWRTNAAGRFALAGETKMIDTIEDELGEVATAWASLSWEYAWLERFADANRVADRGFELRPDDIDVLCAVQAAELRRGNLPLAVTHAARALEVNPYRHVGNERLALLYAKQFMLDEALENSTRSVDLAPFCHVSLDSHACALLVRGEHEAAKMFAERSLSIDPAAEEDEDSDALMIVYALTGEREKLERCLEKSAKQFPAAMFRRYHDHLRELASA